MHGAPPAAAAPRSASPGLVGRALGGTFVGTFSKPPVAVRPRHRRRPSSRSPAAATRRRPARSARARPPPETPTVIAQPEPTALMHPGRAGRRWSAPAPSPSDGPLLGWDLALLTICFGRDDAWLVHRALARRRRRDLVNAARAGVPRGRAPMLRGAATRGSSAPSGASAARSPSPGVSPRPVAAPGLVGGPRGLRPPSRAIFAGAPPTRSWAPPPSAREGLARPPRRPVAERRAEGPLPAAEATRPARGSSSGSPRPTRSTTPPAARRARPRSSPQASASTSAPSRAAIPTASERRAARLPARAPWPGADARRGLAPRRRHLRGRRARLSGRAPGRRRRGGHAARGLVPGSTVTVAL